MAQRSRSGKSEQVQSEVHRGEVAWVLSQVVALHRVDFNGRFRMVRTIKRANADDRWKVVSPRDPFSAADLESTPAEFTCSRGTRGEVNPAAQRLERHPVGALPPDPNHDPVPRRLYLKQSDFMAHGTSDRCPGCRALISGGPCTGPHRGMSKTCRGRNQEYRRGESSSSCRSQSSGRCSHGACIEESSICS